MYPDQMPQTVQTLGLHCLPLIQQFIDPSIGSQTDLFKFYKYGMKLRCPNNFKVYTVVDGSKGKEENVGKANDSADTRNSNMIPSPTCCARPLPHHTNQSHSIKN